MHTLTLTDNFSSCPPPRYQANKNVQKNIDNQNQQNTDILKALKRVKAVQMQMLSQIEVIDRKTYQEVSPPMHKGNASKIAKKKAKRRELRGVAMLRKRRCTDIDSIEDKSDKKSNDEGKIFEAKEGSSTCASAKKCCQNLCRG